MPYANFDDNSSTRMVFDQQQRQDPDLNFGEFVFEKLLCIGQIFEDDEDADEPGNVPIQKQHPSQPLQIQTGFLECYKVVIKIQDLPVLPVKQTCEFKDNKFAREFSSFIFHPPAQA
jgi:hypothetical protein